LRGCFLFSYAANSPRILNAAGKIVCPGLIDMHVHLREPSREEDETIGTGACMPDTDNLADAS
jgi:dihydroorotase